MRTWKKIFRDPIFHFSLLGGALFMADFYASETPSERQSIEIDQAQIEWMKSASKKEIGRLPGDRELENLIDNFVREEVYFREALAMGLERDDVIVRRRLVQKLRFLVEDVATVQTPGDEELRRLFDQLREYFLEPERFSFSHIYFRHSREDARGDAQKSLVQLKGGKGKTPKQLGDPFMMRYHYANQNQPQIAESFGGDFAAQVASLAPGQWHGPFQSAYGWHLVKLSEKRDSYTPAFDDVKESVMAQWYQQQREKANDEAFERLQKTYQIKIHQTQES